MSNPFTPNVRRAFASVIVVAEHPDAPGISRALHRQRARGQLVPLVRGISAPAPAVEPLAPWELAVLRTWVASARGRVRQPLCRASAARLLGVPVLFRQPEPSIHALAWSARGARRSADVRYWSTHDDGFRVIEVEGARLTDLPRTLAEWAATARFADAVAAVDWGLRVRRSRGDTWPITTLDEIREVADALGFVRGRARLERALVFADGRSESAGESWARVLMHELGFEAPDLQHEYRMPDGRRFRADFRWPSIGLVVEFDGFTKYGSAAAREGRSVEQVVVEEKEREDAVRSTGDRVIRLVWDDLRDARRLAHVLDAAGVPRRRGRRTAH